MSRAKTAIDPAKLNNLANFSSDAGRREHQDIEPRKGRSKRGLALADNTSQVCFRIEKDRHKKLKLYCVQNDLEVGELLDTLLSEKLGI